MIDKYLQMKCTSQNGDKLLLTFVDEFVMLSAKIEAEKMGYKDIECDEYGYKLMRKVSDATDCLEDHLRVIGAIAPK